MWTSTPPVNTRPSARTTSARIGASRASESAASRSSSISAPNRLSGGLSSTTAPTASPRSKRTVGPAARSGAGSATQLAGDAGELLLVGLAGVGRQLERVVVVAGDDVQMEVEDRLPGRRLRRVEDVDAVAAEAVAHAPSEPSGG